MDVNETLANLRRHANENDWNECMETLPSVLKLLSREDAIEIGLSQLRKHLPTFERYHRDVIWPRTRLDEAKSLTIRQEPEIFPEIEEEFRTPGSNNFTSGIEWLWYAAETNDLNVRLRFLTDTIGDALMARVVELAYRDHLDKWELRYQYMEVVPETGEWLHPELHDEYDSYQITADSHKAWESSNDYKTRIWLELCDEIEQCLSNQE